MAKSSARTLPRRNPGNAAVCRFWMTDAEHLVTPLARGGGNGSRDRQYLQPCMDCSRYWASMRQSLNYLRHPGWRVGCCARAEVFTLPLATLALHPARLSKVDGFWREQGLLGAFQSSVSCKTA